LNPESWGAIERIKVLMAIMFLVRLVQLFSLFWNLPVILTAAMPVFKYWVGNLSMGTAGYVREEVHVDASTEDGNNFTKNLVTLRAEMRAVLVSFYQMHVFRVIYLLLMN
jgi:hypothetical protein